jgi:4-carboxymuconolactone decarboxylase
MAGGVRFPPLSRGEMTDEQREAHDRVASSPRGGVRGPYPALLRHPALARVHEAYGAHVRYNNVLPDRLKEMAILIVARHWNAEYEWHAHRSIAEKAGVPVAVCDAIARGEEPAGLDADAVAVHGFATRLLREREVDDDTFARVKDRFGDKGVLDLIALIGNYITVAMILNVDRHPIPAGATPLPKLA